MAREIRLISSMATRALLADLCSQLAAQAPAAVVVESVGGVDAAQRVAAGEAFDGVVLAADALDKLIAGGSVLAAGRTELVRSPVAVAVRAGAPCVDIGSEQAVRQAVLAAERIGYSTGPSGTQLLKLLERWGIAAQVQTKLLQAPPGVPVGRLLAEGQVSLAFQQASELMNLDGITVLGALPPAIEIVTTFAGAATRAGTQPDAVARLLALWASPAADDAKRRHGMTPA